MKSMLQDLVNAINMKPEEFLGKKVNCNICEDKGFYEKTEWSGTDDSYDVEVKCECNLD